MITNIIKNYSRFVPYRLSIDIAYNKLLSTPVCDQSVGTLDGDLVVTVDSSEVGNFVDCGC